MLVSNTFKYKLSVTFYGRTGRMIIDTFFLRFILFFFFIQRIEDNWWQFLRLQKKKRIITSPIKGVKIDQLFLKKTLLYFNERCKPLNVSHVRW